MNKIFKYIEKPGNHRRCIESLQEIKINYLMINPNREISLKKDVVRHLYSWKNELDAKGIEIIKNIVRQFKLDYICEEIEELVK